MNGYVDFDDRKETFYQITDISQISWRDNYEQGMNEPTYVSEPTGLEFEGDTIDEVIDAFAAGVGCHRDTLHVDDLTPYLISVSKLGTRSEHPVTDGMLAQFRRGRINLWVWEYCGILQKVTRERINMR